MPPGGGERCVLACTTETARRGETHRRAGRMSNRLDRRSRRADPQDMDGTLDLTRLDADRLIIALERHVSDVELAEARRIAHQARQGRLPLDADAAALA